MAGGTTGVPATMRAWRVRRPGPMRSRPLEFDEDVYRSEKATGSRNRAIAYMLDSFGVLADDPDEVLDVYFRQCSLRVTSADLARMGATLARGGVNPQTGRRVTSTRVVQRTLSVMVTCGMYNAAGDWVSAVGMPAKSGVGGGIVAVLPGQLGIGVYSPLLDGRGNSVRGVLVCRSLSERLGLHFLTVGRESRSTIRAIHEPVERVRVYELHGDLMFAGLLPVLVLMVCMLFAAYWVAKKEGYPIRADGSRTPTDKELALARFQGAHVAKLAIRLQ